MTPEQAAFYSPENLEKTLNEVDEEFRRLYDHDSGNNPNFNRGTIEMLKGRADLIAHQLGVSKTRR